MMQILTSIYQKYWKLRYSYFLWRIFKEFLFVCKIQRQFLEFKRIFFLWISIFCEKSFCVTSLIDKLCLTMNKKLFYNPILKLCMLVCYLSYIDHLMVIQYVVHSCHEFLAFWHARYWSQTSFVFVSFDLINSITLFFIYCGFRNPFSLSFYFISIWKVYQNLEFKMWNYIVYMVLSD